MAEETASGGGQAPYVPEENKRELSFDFDSFNRPAYKEGLWAVAELVRNLLLTAPGTYPNSPEMGIDIKQYQFELLTDDEIRKIQEKIMSQITTYLPSSQIAQVVVRPYTNPDTGASTLGIGFALGASATQSDSFFIFFTRTRDNRLVDRIVDGRRIAQQP